MGCRERRFEIAAKLLGTTHCIEERGCVPIDSIVVWRMLYVLDSRVAR